MRDITTVDNVATFEGFEDVFANIVVVILGFAGIALFIMVIIGGFKYLTSGGDPKKLDSAKWTLTYAIGGMILLMLSFLILRLISELTGANVVNFRVVG